MLGVDSPYLTQGDFDILEKASTSLFSVDTDPRDCNFPQEVRGCYSACWKSQDAKAPLGVTIIAILTIIEGILLILGGVSLIAVGALISVAPHTTTANILLVPQFFGVIPAAIGTVLLEIGIAYLVMFYGLLKGKGWAWTITIILVVIGIAIQIISTTSAAVFSASLVSSSLSNNANTFLSGIIGGIIAIAINVVVVYYLYRPNVKAYFGKANPPEIK